MIRRQYFGIVAAMVLGLASLAMGQQQSGKTAHLTLKAPAQVGTFTLPAGDYEITHRNSPTGHYMEFARVTETNLGYEGSPTYYEREVIANVDCIMQSLSSEVSKSTLEKDGSRIARLEIKGEKVTHNF